MFFSKNISLPTGTLDIHIHESEDLFNHYIDFAARNNPKRGFLFVSKVLGKHYPCQATIMQDSYNALVDLLQKIEKNSQSLVFIGMAETATALGLGVYETWLKQTQKKGIYCQTTRYFLENQPFVNFEEAHSHATGFYLYIPEEKAVKKVFYHADTLVLIDDEISTGNTFANLVNAYKKLNPNLKRVIVISLLNLTSAEARANVADRTDIEFEWLSLLSGKFKFIPNPEFEFKTVSVESNHDCKKHLFSENYGRLGIHQSLATVSKQVESLITDFQAPAKILVLGTGEFIYHAFLVAKNLEKYGFEAYTQSTTRSPILISHAIKDKLEFQDNYSDGIPNYLYNNSMNDYHHVIIVHETPKNSELETLASLLNAILLYIGH